MDVKLGKPGKMVKDREAWYAAVHGVKESDMTWWLNDSNTYEGATCGGFETCSLCHTWTFFYFQSVSVLGLCCGPVVKTLHSQCKGPGVSSFLRN